MKIIQDVIIPTELTNDLYFCCDLKKCKGACCVAGDAGAPLLPEEIGFIIEDLEVIKEFMQPEAAQIISPENIYDYDQDGNLVTALLHDQECIFTCFEAGIAYCAMEKAYKNKRISFRKPISCFLYPIRISSEGAFKKINYHRWDICQPAVEYGNNHKIKLLDFLSIPLKEQFGKEWYKLLHDSLK